MSLRLRDRGGIRPEEGEQDKDWRKRKSEVPSHWVAEPLRWKVVVAVAAVAKPVVVEDTAAAVER